jgi:hypothetical protein
MKRLGLAALAACICTPVLAQTVTPPVTVVPLDGIWATALPFLQAILGVDCDRRHRLGRREVHGENPCGH